MIRAFLVILEIIGYLLFFIPVLLIIYIVRIFNKRMSGEMAQYFIRGVLGLVLVTTGSKVELRGLENIPDEAVLFVGNHRSDFDIVIAYAKTPKRLGFVAKDEMSKIPLLAQWMRLLDCTFLDRKDVKKGMQSILQGIENIKEGTSMWIFPEGTRYSDTPANEVQEFKEGSFRMAQKAKCPVVPVAIYASDKIFEAQKPRIKAANIIMEFCKPIRIDELDSMQQKRLGVMAREEITQTLSKIV